MQTAEELSECQDIKDFIYSAFPVFEIEKFP
jgi:hypothetical protein